MEIIMAAVLLYLLYSVSQRKKKVKEKNIPYAVLVKRAAQVDQIDAWVKSTRTGKNRKKVIASWEYVGDAADTIKVRFRGEKEYTVGKLHFLYDGAGPRVSRFTWPDKDGHQQYIAGLTLPHITMDMLEKSFRLNKLDERKLMYINKVAREALSSGSGIFDICQYEGISLECFNATFGKREVQALSKALDEFDILETHGNLLKVVLAEQPA